MPKRSRRSRAFPCSPSCRTAPHPRTWRRCWPTSGCDPPPSGCRSEEGGLRLDQLLEGRPRVHPGDVARQLRPALRIDRVARMPEVDELGRDPDVADREALADDRVARRELALEVVEEGRQLLLDDLLAGGFVGRAIGEARRHDLADEGRSVGAVDGSHALPSLPILVLGWTLRVNGGRPRPPARPGGRPSAARPARSRASGSPRTPAPR